MHPNKPPRIGKGARVAIALGLAYVGVQLIGEASVSNKKVTPGTTTQRTQVMPSKRLEVDGQSVPLIAFKPNGHTTFKFKAPKQGKPKDLAVVQSPEWTSAVMGNSTREVGMMLIASRGKILKKVVIFDKGSNSVATGDISPAMTLDPGTQPLYSQSDFPSGSTETSIPGEIKVTSTAENLGVKVIEGVLPPQDTSAA